MIIKLYRYYGVLGYEKTPVYADHYVKDYGTSCDEITVEFPDFTSPNFPDEKMWWQNELNEWIFHTGHNEGVYILNKVIVDCGGVPALRIEVPPALYTKPIHYRFLKGKILSEKEC